MLLTREERHALEQIQDFLKREEGHSHGGYYSFGWAGSTLQNLLKRDELHQSNGNG